MCSTLDSNASNKARSASERPVGPGEVWARAARRPAAEVEATDGAEDSGTEGAGAVVDAADATAGPGTRAGVVKARLSDGRAEGMSGLTCDGPAVGTDRARGGREATEAEAASGSEMGVAAKGVSATEVAGSTKDAGTTAGTGGVAEVGVGSGTEAGTTTDAGIAGIAAEAGAGSGTEAGTTTDAGSAAEAGAGKFKAVASLRISEVEGGGGNGRLSVPPGEGPESLGASRSKR